MNIPPGEPKTWTPRRRWIFVAVVFAAQIWIVYHFRDRSGPVAPAPEDESSWRFFPGSLNSDEIATNLLATDPTLFALPNPEGFSGPVWLAPWGINHESPVGNEPVRYLEIDRNSLGGTLSRYLQNHSFPPFEAFNADGPSGEVLGLYVPPEIPETNSVLLLGGELADRGLENPPALPAWPAAEIITNSTVRLLVNAAGAVVSAALVGQSGQAEADAAALRLAGNFRFRPEGPDLPLLPSESGTLSSGNAVFWWATSPLTNAAPLKAPQIP